MEGSSGRVLDAKLGKNGFGIGGGEDGGVIDGSEESTNVLALCGTEAAAKGGSTGQRFKIGYIGPICSGIGVKAEAKKGVGTANPNRFVVFGGERGSRKREARWGIMRRVE